MTTIFKKMILRALSAAIRRVQWTASASPVTTVTSTDTRTTRSGTTKEITTHAQSATEPASSDGARLTTAAGNGAEKVSVPTGDKRATRVAIMQKGGHFAVIVIDTNLPYNDGTGRANIVASLDPRCNPSAHYQNFLTPAEALKQFNESLATSRDHGWRVAHLGVRNNG